jgi:proteasome beta subunit
MDQDISKNILHSGTSIVGIVCKDGVIIAGDRRATAGHLVYSKNEPKVVQINNYLLVAGTGNVSDIYLNRRLLNSELKLLQLKTKERPSIKEAANLSGMMAYKNIRTPSMIPAMVGTIIGGFNEDGTTELYTIEPSGSVQKVETFDANFSSGMPYMLGLLEGEYNPNITVKEGVELGKRCIKAAIERDVGSGNGIDVFAITKSGIQHIISEKSTPNYK